MPGVMDFSALRQETFPSPLTAPRESGATGFRAHAGAKSVLVFPGALRALECAFHDLKSGYVRGVRPAVNRSPSFPKNNWVVIYFLTVISFVLSHSTLS